ncbi:hypothetical protein RRG08_025122 [Elysia crispata]|uniref:Uncharacterized protein n=1 Tax=Elysia crispata TaxID=231223 RepID=A0AAE1AKG1_9GAST|nr:hypothetical protein RRG08_025122 [Elysia crispata]
MLCVIEVSLHERYMQKRYPQRIKRNVVENENVESKRKEGLPAWASLKNSQGLPHTAWEESPEEACRDPMLESCGRTASRSFTLGRSIHGRCFHSNQSPQNLSSALAPTCTTGERRDQGGQRGLRRTRHGDRMDALNPSLRTQLCDLVRIPVALALADTFNPSTGPFGLAFISEINVDSSFPVFNSSHATTRTPSTQSASVLLAWLPAETGSRV